MNGNQTASDTTGTENGDYVKEDKDPSQVTITSHVGKNNFMRTSRLKNRQKFRYRLRTIPSSELMAHKVNSSYYL